MSAETFQVTPVLHLSAKEFDQIRKLAYDQFGLELRDGKEQLVSARLAKVIRTLNLSSFQEYYDYLLKDRSGSALPDMIDALTTNHTSFFREPAHFDFLRSTVLPSLTKRSKITIWSAACSTGEEPYSVAFCMAQYLRQTSGAAAIQILATDISNRVLAHAKRGAYLDERFENLPMQDLKAFLLRGTDNWKGWYRVRQEIRDIIDFRRLNLMENFSQVGTFPVIFCRNVMIYFDKGTQERLVNRLAERLEPGGYLFIGHSESLNRVNHRLQYVQPAIYRKPETGAAPSLRGDLSK